MVSDFFRRERNKLFGDMSKPNTSVKDIVQRSSKAVCGVMEREVVVPKDKVVTTINRLKNAGFVIIGTSFGDTPSKKIWFIRAGGI